MKTLSPHEKINLRAWLSRSPSNKPAQQIRVALPLSDVLYMSYRMTGRSAALLAAQQPPVLRLNA